mmetsp:Transcript_17679/g.50500  ORF Transcript_17679/g.50500 Transcript_17679/m.50500 type:complete len:215 (-) Transcript_17679:3705-4349(-)
MASVSTEASISSPSRYSSASASSTSATASINVFLLSSTSSTNEAGTSVSSTSSPFTPLKVYATLLTKSTTPSWFSDRPIGIWTAQACKAICSRNWSTTLSGFAPARSSLLTKATLGTSYRFICRSTVNDCDWTPETPHNTRTPPSKTLKARSTSIVKSTCPGVSMMLIWFSFQEQWVAADCMVMPFSLSKSMESIFAPTPSFPRTSWMLLMRPV